MAEEEIRVFGCRALSRPEWEKDPSFDNIENRHGNRETLIGLIDEVLATKTLAEWEEVFRKHNVIYDRTEQGLPHVFW